MYLFVDDNWLALDGWMRMLERSGIQVVRINEVDRALVYFRENRASVDCAILDVMMPAPKDWETQGGRRTGLVLADRLRDENPKLPIIFLTAHGDAAVINDLKRYPGAGYLDRRKVRPEDFAERVQSLVKECKEEIG